MDASNLDGQVKDLVRDLATSETHTHANAVRTHFAPDAQLTTPISTVKGADEIRDVLNLHHALAECTVGDVNWDEATKTATVSLKSRYSLGNAPWPFSLLRGLSLVVKASDLKLHLQPDESQPVRSEATEPRKYQVSKVVSPPHPPKNRLFAAAYSVILFTVRIIAPYVVDTLVVAHKFFVRHPLQHGLIRTSAAAFVEIVSWVLSVAKSKVPFIGCAQTKRRPARIEASTETNVDVPSSPVIDEPEVPARKLRSEKKKEEPIKVEARKPESKEAPVMEVIERVGARAQVAAGQIQETVQDTVEQVQATVQDAAKDVQETVQVAAEEVQAAVAPAEEEVKDTPAPEAAEAKEEQVEVAEQTKVQAEEAVKAKQVKEEAKEEVKEGAKEEAKEEVKEEAEEKKVEAEPEAAQPEETVEEPAQPSFAEIAAHQPAQHAVAEIAEPAEDFPSLAEATGEKDIEAPAPRAVDPASATTFAHVAEAADSAPATETAAPSIETAAPAETEEEFPTLAEATGEKEIEVPAPAAIDPSSPSTFAHVAEAAASPAEVARESTSNDSGASTPTAASPSATPASTAQNGNGGGKNKKKNKKSGNKKKGKK